MNRTFLFLLISFSCLAQPRVNKPLPHFSKKPASVLKEDVQGWSYSLDGQWVSAEKKIPVRSVSRNEENYDSKLAGLGLDNFEELRLYPATYGGDSLVALVKTIKNGQYKYEKSRDGWRSHRDAYYFIFSQKDLKNLKNLEAGQVQLIKIPLMADGFLRDIKESKIPELLREHVLIREDSDRELVMTVQPYEFKGDLPNAETEARIRFQIFSQVKVTRDILGVLNDFSQQGKSLYGTPRLFDYLYYECDRNLYNSFFTMSENVNVVKK